MYDMKTQLANVGAAVLAGISISIGGMALLKQGNGFGTVLFSIGLIAVFILGGRPTSRLSLKFPEPLISAVIGGRSALPSSRTSVTGT